MGKVWAHTCDMPYCTNLSLFWPPAEVPRRDRARPWHACVFLHLRCQVPAALLLCITDAQVCNEIWEVGHGEVRRWKGDIQAYKEHLRATHEALNNRKDLK